MSTARDIDTQWAKGIDFSVYIGHLIEWVVTDIEISSIFLCWPLGGLLRALGGEPSPQPGKTTDILLSHV